MAIVRRSVTNRDRRAKMEKSTILVLIVLLAGFGKTIEAAPASTSFSTLNATACSGVADRPASAPECAKRNPTIKVEIVIDNSEAPTDVEVDGVSNTNVIWACPRQKLSWRIKGKKKLQFDIEFDGIPEFPEDDATAGVRASKKSWFKEQVKLKSVRKRRILNKGADECQKYDIIIGGKRLDPVFVIKR